MPKASINSGTIERRVLAASQRSDNIFVKTLHVRRNSCGAIGIEMFSLVFVALAVVPEGEAFTCTPTAVWDGDGPIWCEEGPRIRLSGIAAREMDGSCSPGHPCTTVDAVEARDALVRLVGTPTGNGPHGHIDVRGPAMRCVSDGSAGGSRTAACCVSPIGGDLSCSMVRGGWAAKWERYWKGHKCT